MTAEATLATFVKVSPRFRDLLLVLSDAEMRVLLYLGLSVNAEKETWPSLQNIAKGSHVPKTTVRRAIKSLASRGLIVIHTRRGRGIRTKQYVSTHYHVNHYFAYGADTVDPPLHPLQVPLPLAIEGVPGASASSFEASFGTPVPDSTSALTSRQAGTGVPGSCPSSFEASFGTPVPGMTPESDSAQRRPNFVSGKTARTREEEPGKKNQGRREKKDARTAARPVKPPGDPRVTTILETLAKELGYKVPNYARCAGEVKRGLTLGYTEDEILGCWRTMREFMFWRGKWLPLIKVVENLGEYRAGRLSDSAGGQPRAVRSEVNPDRSIWEKPW